MKRGVSRNSGILFAPRSRVSRTVHVCSKLKHPLLVAREIPVSVNLPSAAGVMGKWESHGVGGIPKRGGKVCFWDFSTERLFHNPSRPRLRWRSDDRWNRTTFSLWPLTGPAH